MSKACESFEVKLVEWAAALRECEDARKRFLDSAYGKREEMLLDAASRRLDKLRGPMETALNRLALDIA